MRVITYGTFDTFHYGHVQLLQRARALGSHLTVGLSSDAFNTNKGKTTHLSFETRKKILSGIRYVDDIIVEDTWEQKRDDITRLKIDIFVIGNDWVGKFDHLSDICTVKYLSRTTDISSTKIKQIIHENR